MARRLLSLLLVFAYLAWLSAWFWVFSFGFSAHFFEYHLGTHIPVFFLALVSIAVPPLSCYWTLGRALKGTLGQVRAALLNLAISAAPLGLFWVILAGWVALARWTGHLAFEADEAMGNGIVFMFCVAVVLVAVLCVPLILGGVALWKRRKLRGQ